MTEHENATTTINIDVCEFDQERNRTGGVAGTTRGALRESPANVFPQNLPGPRGSSARHARRSGTPVCAHSAIVVRQPSEHRDHQGAENEYADDPAHDVADGGAAEGERE